MNRLGRRQGADLVARVTEDKSLPAEIVDQIVARTDGVPLFIEELTRTVLDSGLLADAGDRYELPGLLPPLAIPTTLHDSLMARLDRLAPVKEVAQIGAVIGREFSHELLVAVADRPEDELRAALDQLVASELVFRRCAPPDATYSFKHALVQDAAYQSLLRSRRQHPELRGHRRREPPRPAARPAAQPAQHREPGLGRHRVPFGGQRRAAGAPRAGAAVPAPEAARPADAAAPGSGQCQPSAGPGRDRARLRCLEMPPSPGHPFDRPSPRQDQARARQPGHQHAPPGLVRDPRRTGLTPIRKAQPPARFPQPPPSNAPSRRRTLTRTKSFQKGGSSRCPTARRSSQKGGFTWRRASIWS